MRHYFAVIGGVVAVVCGCSLVLFALPPAFVQPRNLRGVGYCLAVATSLFTLGTARLAVVGLPLILGGVALNLRAAFPEGREMAISRAGRAALFCGLVFLGTVALIAILLGITLSTLGAEQE